MLHTAATAYLGLFHHAHLRPGETILVSGAGGGVGSAVVQLAAAAGARVLATTRSDDTEWSRACGAEEVYDYHDPQLSTKIAGAAPNGLDVYWHTSSHYDFPETLRLLAHGARIVVMAGMTATPTLPVGQLYTKDASVHGFAITNATATQLGDAARAINHALARGVLHARVSACLPLAQAAEVHRRQETHETHGRIIVTPRPGEIQ